MEERAEESERMHGGECEANNVKKENTIKINSSFVLHTSDGENAGKQIF